MIRSARCTRRAAPWLALLLVVAACSTTPAPSPSAGGASSSPTAVASGLARLTQDEWSVEYPAAWRYSPISDFITSFYTVYGYLGSVPVDTSRICQTTPSSKSCDAGAYDLPPGSVVITIANGGSPMTDPVAFWDHPTEGTPTRVGGMAAIISEASEASDRVLLVWQIARPDAFGNWVQLAADVRGPGTDGLRAQVDAIVASLRFSPEPTPISGDPAVARAVARKALAELKTDAAYACFPDEAGASRQATVTSMPFGPALSSPVPVTCSASISPTDIGFWKLDLTITWGAAANRRAGSNITTQWLAPDGALGASTGSGDTPGG